MKNVKNSGLRKRKFGILKGKIKIAKDFDAPLDLVIKTKSNKKKRDPLR